MGGEGTPDCVIYIFNVYALLNNSCKTMKTESMKKLHLLQLCIYRKNINLCIAIRDASCIRHTYAENLDTVERFQNILWNTKSAGEANKEITKAAWSPLGWNRLSWS